MSIKDVKHNGCCYIAGMDTEQIIEALKQERTRISQAIAVLEGTGNAGMSGNSVGRHVRRGRRHMSPEARARIAAAQRRRWAALKAGKKK